jgi:hypothetical protein
VGHITEENIRRKNLTPVERSKELVRKADRTAELLRERTNGADAAAEAGPQAPSGGDFSGTAPEKSRGRPPAPTSEERVAEALGVDQKTLNNAKHHVAAIGKYPALGSPDASQREVLALQKRLDDLPADEAPHLLGVLQGMSLPWRKFADAVARVTGWSPPQRHAFYRLASAETQRERSRAITLATDAGPSPDPQLGRVQEMRSWLGRARGEALWCLKRYPDDPWGKGQACRSGLRCFRLQACTLRDRISSLS